MMSRLKENLDAIYGKYHQREYVDPDPLVFLYRYPQVQDREIAGLVAASLAYGRVEMIMKTVDLVLERLGPSPHEFLTGTRENAIDKIFAGFKYRFATAGHLSCLIKGIRRVILDYNSLENCFCAGVQKAEAQKIDAKKIETGKPEAREKDETILSGLAHLFREITRAGEIGHLLADPGKTSACKRSHLFLRWMVRKDAVDPGGWERVSPAQLIIPLDTHMYRIGQMLGFTQRKNPDQRCALEITAGFRKIIPHDPVRYDFSLTRFGIRRNLDMDQLGRLVRFEGSGRDL